MNELFHLHFATGDLDGTERAFCDLGFAVERRFGSVRGDPVALDSGEPEPDEFRLKLETLRRGAVDITLAPGRRFAFDHLGILASDDVLDAARAADWSVRESGGRRTFVMTPWGFRVEVVAPDGDVAATLGSRAEAHLANVDLRVPATDASDSLDDVFGPISGLTVGETGAPRAHVAAITLAGDAFPATPTIDPATLG